MNREAERQRTALLLRPQEEVLQVAHGRVVREGKTTPHGDVSDTQHFSLVFQIQYIYGVAVVQQCVMYCTTVPGIVLYGSNIKYK